MALPARRALITGITGQDGSYLADLLLERGYAVFGLVRRSGDGAGWRVAHLKGRVTFIEGDVLDQGSLTRALEESQPHEIYHLAAQSFVGRSFREPAHTIEVTGLGALRMLEAMRSVSPKARLFQASSSEMFGNFTGPINPSGPFAPRSPYGAAKVLAHNLAVNYREAYGLFVVCGVMFNHESPRRGAEFVTRKVAAAAARIAAGSTEPLRIGNLAARRDWGWAPDYVTGMHAMLQQDAPVDHILATGRTYSVRELCQEAFAAVGLAWEPHTQVDPAFFRPAEIDVLIGDPGPAERALGWERSRDFAGLVHGLVEAEVERLQSARS